MEDGLPVFPPRICLVVMTKGTPRSVLQGAPSFLTFLNVRSSPEGKAVTDPLHSFHFAAPSPLSAWTTFEYDHCSHCRGCEILDLQLAIPLLFLSAHRHLLPAPPDHRRMIRTVVLHPGCQPPRDLVPPPPPPPPPLLPPPSSLLHLGRQDWCPSISGRSYLEKYFLHFPSPKRRTPQIASPSPPTTPLGIRSTLLP